MSSFILESFFFVVFWNNKQCYRLHKENIANIKLNLNWWYWLDSLPEFHLYTSFMLSSCWKSSMTAHLTSAYISMNFLSPYTVPLLPISGLLHYQTPLQPLITPIFLLIRGGIVTHLQCRQLIQLFFCFFSFPLFFLCVCFAKQMFELSTLIKLEFRLKWSLHSHLFMLFYCYFNGATMAECHPKTFVFLVHSFKEVASTGQLNQRISVLLLKWRMHVL